MRHQLQCNSPGRLLGLVAFCLILFACGGGGGGGNSAPPMPPSSNADLDELALSVSAVSPAFRSTTTTYALNTANSDSSITVTPTTSDARATVTVDGVTVNSGSTSSAIPLTVGVNTLDITVTAEDGNATQTYIVRAIRPPANVIALADPTPGVDNRFGDAVAVLGNGNIVVTDPFDASSGANENFTNGAVHLFDSSTRLLIASIYGETEGDNVGSHGITVLPNDNFVIASANDDENAVRDVGSVRLIDGTTGLQIGAAIAGDIELDNVGGGGIFPLSDNSFVIASPSDDEGGILNSGSIRLIDGTTGSPIGNPIIGDSVDDAIGDGTRLSGGNSITVLSNNNFVIASPFDDEGGISNTGSVRLVDGATGTQIGSAIAGDAMGDRISSSDGIHPTISALPNSNFAVASPFDDDGAIGNAGSVRLVDGATGLQIGSAIVGDAAEDRLGNLGVFALANNNYVIGSPNDDEGGLTDGGSVSLINGTTGLQIAIITGDTDGDQIGQSIVPLPNGNYVIESHLDTEGGVTTAGSVRLMDGATGAQIGTAITGDVDADSIGSGGVTALPNSNFVITSHVDDENGVADAGSIRLVNGTTGMQIAAFTGDTPRDSQFTFFGSTTPLANGNYVVVFPIETQNSVLSSSVVLTNGTTGVQIGSTAAEFSVIPEPNDVTVLPNNNYAVISQVSEEIGITAAGSVRFFNGSTGVEFGDPLIGIATLGFRAGAITSSASGDFYVLSLPFEYNDGLENSGLLRLITQ